MAMVERNKQIMGCDAQTALSTGGRNLQMGMSGKLSMEEMSVGTVPGKSLRE